MMGIPGRAGHPVRAAGHPGPRRVFGGFQYELLDQTGGEISGLADAAAALSAEANKSGQVVGLFSSFRANDPQLVVDLDRDKARSLNLPLREVTDALQVFLGSAYVNDFDFNNRAYRVYVQADQQFRAGPKDLRQLYARATDGAMVPLDSVVRLRETTAPQVISHFNLFRSAEINGAAAPGVSSGEALEAMEEISRDAAAPGLRLRVGRPVARGEEGRLPGHLHLRAQPDPRVPRARRAVRELGAARSSSCSACRWP